MNPDEFENHELIKHTRPRATERKDNEDIKEVKMSHLVDKNGMFDINSIIVTSPLQYRNGIAKQPTQYFGDNSL